MIERNCLTCKGGRAAGQEVRSIPSGRTGAVAMVAAVESPVISVEIPLVDRDAVEAFLLLLLPYVYGLASREQRVLVLILLIPAAAACLADSCACTNSTKDAPDCLRGRAANEENQQCHKIQSTNARRTYITVRFRVIPAPRKTYKKSVNPGRFRFSNDGLQ
jgi:hypothetical protein